VKRHGLARRRLLASLVPAAEVVVDVGADHGHVAAWVGAIATERRPHRSGRTDVRWVIADGLMPFRRVDVAIVAGMGWRTIARILQMGPRPPVAVLHAQDDPPALRRWLASHGWRIDAEGLAPEAGRFAEVVRAVPGQESAGGLLLELGPRLLEGSDPHLRDHLVQLVGYWRGIAARTATSAPEAHQQAAERVSFLEARISSL
jgi:tRNA (adenine22-N1)-methyltransferase